MTVRILKGDCRDVLRELEPESVHCVVTSPPYWGLRDYGVAGQIGLEGSFAGYVEQMRNVFAQVWRVMRKDGTLWLNLGDSYTGTNNTNRGGNANWGTQPGREIQASFDKQIGGLKPKDLCGIPWRVAFALQADGWYLRSDIIWSKPNPMPESVTDRPTKAHEYLFLLSKSERYYYDGDAVREPYNEASLSRYEYKFQGSTSPGRHKPENKDERYKQSRDGDTNPLGRNRRSVWEIATAPFSEAHFATFPPALIEPCIMAGCPKQCCAKCGAPWAMKVERTDELDTSAKGSRFDAGKTGARDGGDRTQAGERFIKRTVGSLPSCSCNAGTVPGTVLDPFFGAGTTGLVADRLERNCIGVELNRDYADMAERRIRGDAGMFAQVAAE